MITDEILSAVQGMIDRFSTPEAKRAGTAILGMLADFDEDSWRDLNDSGTVDEWFKQYIEEFTDMERGLSSEVKRLQNMVSVLEEEKRKLRFEKSINWLERIIDSLPDLPDYSEGTIWSDGSTEILVETESAAETIADLITSLYRAQGEDVLINTGYYDPEEDRRNNEEDRYTGWWYVNVD